jgi:ABC-2 type transport system ATP-binding protein
MINLQGVSRWYGQVIGLNDVTCEIGPGVTALLGMNGSGKSTMMRLITGQLYPTTGEVYVEGMKPFANPEVYKILGYCPEIDSFYEKMSGREFVRAMGRLSGFSSAESKRRTDEMMEVVGMTDRCDKPIRGYSKGMRQRIKLAQAMLHDPQCILLDEPLNGLDPVGRHEYIQILRSFAEKGKTILVSSHILFEVEQMTRSILLLHRGRLLAAGDLGVIRELLDKFPHRVRIETEEVGDLAGYLVTLPYVHSLRKLRGGVELQVTDPDSFYETLPKVAEVVREQNVKITKVSSPDNNLESIFRYLVGEVSNS